MTKKNTEIKDSGFKLLAIRPLKGCNANIRKNLKEGMLYKFYNDYSFYVKVKDKQVELTHSNYKSFKENEISEIQLRDNTISLYNLLDQPNINISAIVGKNGSGKSALLELFYLANYIIATKAEILEPNLSTVTKEMNEIEKLENFRKDDFINKSYKQLLSQEEIFKSLYKSFKAEVYYSIGDSIFCININNRTIEYKLIKGSDVEKRNYKIDTIIKSENFEIIPYFYTIAINYSLYGLNELDNFWLKPLFHKNDAYKTPIVINPYRDEGNIDINSELHLAQTRTLLNLSSKNESNPEIVNSKKISKVKFVMDIENNNHINITRKVSLNFGDVMKKHTKKHSQNLIELFNEVALKLTGLNIPISKNEDLYKYIDLQQAIELTEKSEILKELPVDVNRVKFEMIKYAVRKLFKICIQYSREYGSFIEITDDILITDLNGLLTKVKSDKSHLTLKLRQIIYSIFSNYLFQENKWTKIAHEKNSYSIEFEWEKLSSHITESEVRFNKYLNERMEVIPAAFLKPVILIANDKNVKHKFNGLSSGEQQLANAIQTVIYHLYNLNSVHQSLDENRLKYKHINIVFDEIELYFHPEFQRTFIDELLKSIKQLNFDKGIESVNILFSTHSPFILSDIPSSNILRLKDGNPEIEGNQTFGANIHDLLANDFFLKNGFMGEFAHKYITDLIDEINKLDKNISMNLFREYIGKVDFIAEPFIKYKMIETLESKIGEYSDELNEIILRKEQELEELKSKRGHD